MKENGAHLRYDIISSLVSKNEDFLKETDDGGYVYKALFNSATVFLLVDVSSLLDRS